MDAHQGAAVLLRPTTRQLTRTTPATFTARLPGRPQPETRGGMLMLLSALAALARRARRLRRNRFTA